MCDIETILVCNCFFLLIFLDCLLVSFDLCVFLSEFIVELRFPVDNPAVLQRKLPQLAAEFLLLDRGLSLLVSILLQCCIEFLLQTFHFQLRFLEILIHLREFVLISLDGFMMQLSEFEISLSLLQKSAYTERKRKN